MTLDPLEERIRQAYDRWETRTYRCPINRQEWMKRVGLGDLRCRIDEMFGFHYGYLACHAEAQEREK